MARKERPTQASPMDAEIKRRADIEAEALQRTATEKMMGPTLVIGEQELIKANEILRKYKGGKARLEEKIIANEEFWKLRQWNYISDADSQFKPATPWLWACIQSRYSDTMDSYPTCNFQPRQEDDKQEAKMLSDIVPIILEQNRYEDTYSDIAWYALKHGGCVQGVFWDKDKHNGLGDIAIKKIDFLNIFWEAGVTDIQDSQNVFTTELVSREIVEQRYPQCQGKLTTNTVSVSKYIYDDHVDTTDKVVVVDWYYKKYINGKLTLQYVKYVDTIVLYATENDTQRPESVEIDPLTNMPVTVQTGLSMAERGLYDHAMYPFVTMPLFPVEGSLCGYGLTDIGRDTQIVIDKLNKAFTENAIVGATPRYFIKNDGSVNEEEYADFTKPFVHVDGRIDGDSVVPIEHKPLDNMYVTFLTEKIDELKFVTSNQDATNGIAPNGITAGSAISALQESAGKNARSSNKSFHRAYRDVVYQIIELIRQFYDVPRTFRINPDGMSEQFVEYDNSGLKPQPMMTMGTNMGLRLPEFDIDVTSEKANPYKKMEINELALNFYAQGFFNPQMTDQALACLNMMDFTKKDEVMNKIAENGTLQENLIKWQQIAMQLANQIDPALGESVANEVMNSLGQPLPQGGEPIDLNKSEEHPFNEKARSQARASTEAD